jgi:hypothetical protein
MFSSVSDQKIAYFEGRFTGDAYCMSYKSSQLKFRRFFATGEDNAI